MVIIAVINEMTMKDAKILLLALLLIIVGCQGADPVTDKAEEPRFIAAMEDIGAGTRTVLDGNKVLWSSGDRIIVFDGDDSGETFVLNAAYSGLSYGEFIAVNGSGTAGTGEKTDAVVALYPYACDIALSKEGDVLMMTNIHFPSEQTYVPSSFADSSFPMVSVAPEGKEELQFRNLGGVMHLSVKGKGAVSSVTLEGNEGELLSGFASVSLKQGTQPVTYMDDDASGSVTLICSPSVELSEDKSVDFYISLPPVEFSSGFSVTFEFDDGSKIIKNTSKPNNVKRSAVLHMPEFSLSDMPVQCVDLGLSVKWAAWNVGADKPEDYGGYYAWGEIEEKSSYSDANYVYYDSQSDSYSDIGSDISGTEYDVAAVEWGDGWRMPTMEELQELLSSCIWSKANVGGVGGHNVEGPNGNSIFIPNTGYCQGNAKYFADDYMDGNSGCLWSATLAPGKGKEAYILTCSSGSGMVVYRYWERRMGLPVRPVRD